VSTDKNIKTDTGGPAYEFSLEELELLSEHSERERAELEARIISGELPAYVLGKKYFFRNYFTVNEACLIPRPDTERVVEALISELPAGGVFADLCTGTGCIALSALAERPDARAYICDVSERALEAARENAISLNVGDRVEIDRLDVMKSLPQRIFDVIVSNPPYLCSDEIDDYPSLTAEPRTALDGGGDGLDFYRRFISDYTCLLAPQGIFIFEIGFEQADAVAQLAKQYGFSCTVKKDYGGNDRVALLKRT